MRRSLAALLLLLPWAPAAALAGEDIPVPAPARIDTPPFEAAPAAEAAPVPVSPAPPPGPDPASERLPIGKPAGVEGATPAGPAALQPPEGWSRNLTAFLVVGALLGLGIWILKRTLPGRMGGRSGSSMEILGRQPVGPKHAVVLLRVAGRILVVGVGPETMTTLAEIQETAEVERLLLKEPGPSGGASFRGRLESVLSPLRQPPLGAFGGEGAGEADAEEGEIRALGRRVASWRTGEGSGSR